MGRLPLYDEPRARVGRWPPLRPARLRFARESVVVVSPTWLPCSSSTQEGLAMRVIGLDVHRTFAEVDDAYLRTVGATAQNALDITTPIVRGCTIESHAGPDGGVTAWGAII